MTDLMDEHKKLNPDYKGSLAAPLPTYPEEVDDVTLKDWEHWEWQQAEAMRWFDRLELEEK